MVSLFRRRSDRSEIPRTRPRAPKSKTTNVNRVALGELTPPPIAFLGQAAYLQLAMFETAAHAVSTAPQASGKNAMSRVAQLSLAKYEGLIAELKRAGHDPVAEMAPFVPATDAFRTAIAGGNWCESLVSVYVVAGLLDEFFVRLAEGLDDDQSRRIATLMSPDRGSEFIVVELSAAIAADPPLASRLALWGRRLVGDTLLVARSALAVPVTTTDDARLEPVFTELIAAHTRRMDALGLTA